MTCTKDEEGRDVYTWDSGFGPQELTVRSLERAFLDWAKEEGYSLDEAVMVMGEDGGDCRIELYDAWPVFVAGWDAKEAASL